MEIERKFLLNIDRLSFIEGLNLLSKSLIEQMYISLDNNEVRIRKKSPILSYLDYSTEDEYTMTIKSDGDLSRKEVEFKITKEVYNSIVKSGLIIAKRIKYRYVAEYKDDIYEIDEYLDEFEGLKVAEVEFKSEEEASKFKVPNWLGREITYDKEYKNKNLKVKKYYD